MGIEQLDSARGGEVVEMRTEVIETFDHLAQKLRLLRRGNIGIRNGGEEGLCRCLIQPLRVIGRAGKCNQSTILGQQRSFHPIPKRHDMEATADEQQGRPALDRRGPDHPAALGKAGLERIERRVHDIPGKRFDDWMGTGEVELIAADGQVEPRPEVRAGKVAGIDQHLAQCQRSLAQIDLEVTIALGQMGAGGDECLPQKKVEIAARAD